MTKITPKQWEDAHGEIFCTIDCTKAEFESLAADAELGRATVEDHTEWANMMCPSNGKFKMRDDECCEYEDKDCGCQWYNTCRASAGKGGV
jgi:hypothetical protein